MNKLSAKDFAQHLKSLGLLPENTRRIIIDVQTGDAVKVYYDTFASQTLLQAITPEFLMNADKIVHKDKGATATIGTWAQMVEENKMPIDEIRKLESEHPR